MGVADGRGNSSLMTAMFTFLGCLLQTPPLPGHPQAPGCKALLHKHRRQLSPTHCNPTAGLWGRQAVPEPAGLSQCRGAAGTKKLLWSKAKVAVADLSCLTVVLWHSPRVEQQPKYFRATSENIIQGLWGFFIELFALCSLPPPPQ